MIGGRSGKQISNKVKDSGLKEILIQKDRLSIKG